MLGNEYRTRRLAGEARQEYLTVLSLSDQRGAFGWSSHDEAMVNLASMDMEVIDRVTTNQAEALGYLRHVVEHDPHSTGALQLLAVLLSRRGDCRNALKVLDMARDQDDTSIIYSKAQCYRELRECDKAMELYRQVARWGLPVEGCL